METLPLPLKIKLNILLRAKKYEEAKDLLVSKPSFNEVVENGMEIIPEICERGLNETDESKEISICADMLVYVAKYMSPKLGIISFLEQAEAFNMSSKFTVLLEPLRIIISRTSKKPSNIAWILKVLSLHLNIFHAFPETMRSQFHDDENGFLLENDTESQQILHYYQELSKFYELLIEELFVDEAGPGSSTSSSVDDILKLRCIVRNNLVVLLGSPLVHMNLSWKSQVESCFVRPGEVRTGPNPKSKTTSLLIAENIMQLIAKVNYDCNYFINWIEEKNRREGSSSPTIETNVSEQEANDDNLVEPDNLAVSNYMFLLYGEKLTPTQLPQTVYSVQYIFHTNLYLVNELLNNKQNHPSLHIKGLGLARGILSQVQSSALFTADWLDQPLHDIFIDRLMYLLVFSETRQVRAAGIDLFTRYVWSYESRGKYIFLSHLFQVVTHAGLYGHCIGLLKQFILVALQEESLQNCNMQQFFLGQHLKRILEPFFALESGVETDLIKISDKIMALLNLLWLLLIRDTSDRAGIKQLLGQIEAKFLKPLHSALDLSKVRYELQLKETETGRASTQSKKPDSSSIEIEVVGQNGEIVMPGEESKEGKIAALKCALNTLDLMYCVLAHVNKCIQQ